MRLPTPSRGRERRGGGHRDSTFECFPPPFVVRGRLIVGGRIRSTLRETAAFFLCVLGSWWAVGPLPKKVFLPSAFRCAGYAVGGRRVSYFARYFPPSL